MPPATQPHPEGTGCRARGALAPRRAATRTFGSPTWHFPKVPSRSRGIPACRRVPVLWERRRRTRPVHTPTIRAFRPPRSLLRASERGLWGNANVGRILAGSRRWNPAMSSRTHSPAALRGFRATPRVPGTAVFGCAEPCWDRPWQKVERPSTPTSGQKARLRQASGGARANLRLRMLVAQLGASPTGEDFSQMRHLKGARRLGKVFGGRAAAASHNAFARVAD